MNPPLFRRILGLSAILMVILLTYRQQANGRINNQKPGKLLSVTAATHLAGKKTFSPVLVKGLLRKNKKAGHIYLVDEDSLSTNPRPFSARFSDTETAQLDSLEEDTELVVEGQPDQSGLQEGLTHCSIISINYGTVYTDHFPEQ